MGNNLEKVKVAWNILTSTGPIKLTVAITYACNLRCKTCNIWQIYKKSPEKARAELTTDEWIRLFSRLKKTRYVSITGGEPTLRNDLPEILQTLDKNPNVLAISLNTNGAMVEKILDGAPKNTYLRVHVSMMGPAAVDEAMRGPGSHKKAIKAVEKLADAGIDTYVEFTATQSNIDGFDKLLGELDEVGLPRNHVIITFYNVGEYYKNDGKRFVSGDFAEKSIKMGVNTPEMLLFLKLTKKYGSGTRRFCTAAKKSLFIDPYGYVFPCIFRLDVNMGNVKEYEYSVDKLFDENAKIAENEIRTCSGCWTPCETITGFAAYPWRVVL